MNYHRFEILIIFASIALIGSSCAEENPALEERLQKFWKTNMRQLAADAWKLPKDERKMLLREFTDRLFAGKWGPAPYHNGDSIRLRLGDRELTKQSAEKFAKDVTNSDSYSLDASGSPLAIEYLAPLIYSDERFSLTPGDVMRAPPSFAATSIIWLVLKDTSAFTGEVTNWARATKAPDPTLLREELQRWWQENKIHFDQEDYKAVKPGREIVRAVVVIDQNRRKLGLPTMEETMRITSGAPPPTPAPAPTAPTPEIAPPSSDSLLFCVLGGGIALIAAAIALLARRKR